MGEMSEQEAEMSRMEIVHAQETAKLSAQLERYVLEGHLTILLLQS